MSRALRRHHTRRLKAKWRRLVVADMTVPWRGISRWTDNDIDRYVGKRVNHPRHQCVICKIGIKYNRATQRRIDRKELDMSYTL